jgi:site-specific recombinase XerC
MSRLSPTTLTSDEQALILRVTAPNVRDHVIFSLALGTGLRLGEIVGLDVGDVFCCRPFAGTTTVGGGLRTIRVPAGASAVQCARRGSPDPPARC